MLTLSMEKYESTQRGMWTQPPLFCISVAGLIATVLMGCLLAGDWTGVMLIFLPIAQFLSSQLLHRSAAETPFPIFSFAGQGLGVIFLDTSFQKALSSISRIKHVICYKTKCWYQISPGLSTMYLSSEKECDNKLSHWNDGCHFMLSQCHMR